MIAQLRGRPGVVPDMRRLSLLLALLALAAPAAPAHADETVATLPGITRPRAYRDIVVWSVKSPHGYQLFMRRGTSAPVLVPIAEREQGVGFDIGSDAKGAPLLAYTRCRRSCDIYTATLAGKERRIAAASAPGEDEVRAGCLTGPAGVAAWQARLHAQALRPPERPVAAAVHDAPRRPPALARRARHLGHGASPSSARSCGTAGSRI